MDYEHILFDQHRGVAKITLNRPERLNALNVRIGIEMLDAFETCEHDEEVRAIILTGAGRAFCAGDDLKGMTDSGVERRQYSDPTKQYVYGEGRWTTVVRTMRRVPKPIIAMINGHAHGAGFNLALGCDFRIMSETATLCIPFSKWAMATGTNLLQQYVGIGKAIEWALLATTLSAREAERWGLVTKVVPPEKLEAETDEFVVTLAKGPTKSYGFTKNALYKGWGQDPDSAYEHQGLAQHFARGTEDRQEGARAFAEKRLPEFKGR